MRGYRFNNYFITLYLVFSRTFQFFDASDENNWESWKWNCLEKQVNTHTHTNIFLCIIFLSYFIRPYFVHTTEGAFHRVYSISVLFALRMRSIAYTHVNVLRLPIIFIRLVRNQQHPKTLGQYIQKSRKQVTYSSNHVKEILACVCEQYHPQSQPAFALLVKRNVVGQRIRAHRVGRFLWVCGCTLPPACWCCGGYILNIGMALLQRS